MPVVILVQDVGGAGTSRTSTAWRWTSSGHANGYITSAAGSNLWYSSEPTGGEGSGVIFTPTGLSTPYLGDCPDAGCATIYSLPVDACCMSMAYAASVAPITPTPSASPSVSVSPSGELRRPLPVSRAQQAAREMFLPSVVELIGVAQTPLKMC